MQIPNSGAEPHPTRPGPAERATAAARALIFGQCAGGSLAPRRPTARTLDMVEPVTVPCEECAAELAADSPDLRLERTYDDEPIIYCASVGSGSSSDQDVSSPT